MPIFVLLTVMVFYGFVQEDYLMHFIPCGYLRFFMVEKELISELKPV